MVPGSRALGFASRWFKPALVHSTFEPLIADWQREWYESAPSRRLWVSMRAWFAFVCAVAITAPAIVRTPVPRSLSHRVVTRIALFCLVPAAALSVPMVRSLESPAADAPLWAAVLLMAMPVAVTGIFPFAMISAVDVIRRRNDIAAHVARAAVLKLAIIAVAVMGLAASVITPMAVDTWRRVSTPPGWNTPPPRPQHLSTAALLVHPERSTAIVPTPQYTRAGDIRRELFQRSVATVMPAMLVWLRWVAVARPRRYRFWPLPASAMTAVALVVFLASSFGGFVMGYRLDLLPGTGLVLPLIVFGAWALIEQRFASAAAGGAAAQDA